MPSPVLALICTVRSKYPGRAVSSIHRGRSDLLTTAMARFARPATASASLSRSVSGCEPSNTAITSSEFSAASSALRTPRRSTSPPASRSPAVSVMRSSTPPSTAFSSIVSRVVPGSEVTIARSYPRSAFISELFPTFGRPMSEARRPSRSTRPRSNVASSAPSDAAPSSRRRAYSSSSKGSMSSSG